MTSENKANLEAAHQEPESQLSSPPQARYNIVNNITSLPKAVRTIFHASAPHPANYRDEDGNIDVSTFKVDLNIWAAHVATVWKLLCNTQNAKDCRCCVTFQALVTNWHDVLRNTMDSEDFSHKRVNGGEIIRCANGISHKSAKAAMESIRDIAEAMISEKNHPRVSDITDSSAEEDDTDTIVSDTSESKYSEELADVSEGVPVYKKMRRPRRAPRPLKHVDEISDDGDELTIALPEIKRVISLNIAHNPFIGRSGLCNYAKYFFIHMIRAKAFISAWSMMGYKHFCKEIKRQGKVTVCDKVDLHHYLSRVKSCYTKRYRKQKTDEC